ncbi:MAG TPA: patatin-like phospholipase family protein [Acidobacteriota bacterium]|nr:patatin-like phospholipase family protein [Acidobacteriota bacterium]
MRAVDAVHGHVRVGLALSGGGSRGLAQLGVLKVLEREGVPIDLVAGTSIGSVVGGIYACLGNALATEARVLETVRSGPMQGLDLDRILKLSGVSPVSSEGADTPRIGLLGRAQHLLRRMYVSHAALTRPAVLDGAAVIEVFEGLFEGRTFDQTAIPFAAVAVDVEEGCEVIVANGSIARGVAASSAIAGIFPPVVIEGRKLIDGGYTSPVPIDAAQMLGANVVIAVDVSQRGRDTGGLENAVEVAMRSSEISLEALEQEQLRRADVVIPAHGALRHWSDYSAPREAIDAGERATERLVNGIHEVIRERARLFV